MKNAFQAVSVMIVAGLVTFGVSQAWHYQKQQNQKLERLIHSVETLKTAQETPPPPPPPEQVSSTPAFPLFQAIEAKPTIDEATSPDGEWIADVRALGRSPFNRGTSFWLELINQTGKPNRMIYMDWFERPRDARIQPYPIGWSADGRSIYLSYGNLPGANAHEPGAYTFMNAGEVFRVSLDSQEGYANNRVNPYHGNYPKDSIGRLLDIIPRQNVGLWLEEIREEEDGKGETTPKKSTSPETRLFLFSLEDASSPRTIATIRSNQPGRIVSATMSSDAKDIFYALHQDKQSDKLFYVNAEATPEAPVEIDLHRFARDLRKQGLKAPYTIELEKTALTNKNDLFLILTDAKGKRVTYRWMNLNGRPSLGRD